MVSPRVVSVRGGECGRRAVTEATVGAAGVGGRPATDGPTLLVRLGLGLTNYGTVGHRA